VEDADVVDGDDDVINIGVTSRPDVVDGAGYDDGHDGDPHAVHDVALHRAVDEDAVADRLVVVEVAADDGRTEVNDDAGDVDDGDAERDAADARRTLDADVLLTAQTRTQTLHSTPPSCCYLRPPRK